MDRSAENERKKEFLRSYRKRKKHIEALGDQEEELRASKLGVSCGIGDGMPHAHNQADLSAYMARLDEINSEIIHERYLLVKESVLVSKAIKDLKDGDEVFVLTKRYMMGWDWDRIAAGMGYALRNVHYIHSRALKHLEIPAEWEQQA